MFFFSIICKESNLIEIIKIINSWRNWLVFDSCILLSPDMKTSCRQRGSKLSKYVYLGWTWFSIDIKLKILIINKTTSTSFEYRKMWLVTLHKHIQVISVRQLCFNFDNLSTHFWPPDCANVGPMTCRHKKRKKIIKNSIQHSNKNVTISRTTNRMSMTLLSFLKLVKFVTKSKKKKFVNLSQLVRELMRTMWNDLEVTEASEHMFLWFFLGTRVSISTQHVSFFGPRSPLKN